MPNHLLNDTHLGSISVFLNSGKASITLNGSKNSSCFFYLNNNVIQPPPNALIMLGVTSAEVPYTFYNIDARNNKITFATAEITTQVTVPPKNYSTNSLTKFFNDQLVSEGITCSFDEDTNKFSFSHSDGIRITQSDMNKELGIAPSQLNQALETTFVSANVCNLSGTSSVYININNLSMTNLDSRGDLNGVIAKLNVNAAPAEFIFYQQTENQYFIIGDRQIDKFHVSLTDDDNELLDLNGVDWSVTFTVHFSLIRNKISVNDWLVDTRNENFAEENQGKKQK